MNMMISWLFLGVSEGLSSVNFQMENCDLFRSNSRVPYFQTQSYCGDM